MSGRLAVVFLIPAGALAGHATAYAVSDGHSHTGLAHGYLSGVSLVAVPLALVALLWLGCQGAMRRRRPSLGPLLVAQPLLFLGQEGFEHLLAGHGLASIVHSPAVRIGVIAQAFLAGVTLVVVRGARATGRAVAAALRRRRRGWGARPLVPRPSAATTVVSGVRYTAASERGPPLLSSLA